MLQASAAIRPARRPKKKGRRLGRFLALIGCVGLGAVALTWFLVHRYEWAGPLVANSLRAVVGVDNVARLEDFVYGVEDRVNRLTRKNEEPHAHWQVPATPLSAASATKVVAQPSEAAAPAELPAFRLADPGPALEAWSAAGDGKWVAMVDPRRPSEPTYLYKTLLHPDAGRSWAEVFVVAVDLRRTQIVAVAGSREPSADSAEGERYPRPALIPASQRAALLGAFNGGFMTEHGGYGMQVDGVTLVKPKPNACTIVVGTDDSLRIGRYSKLEPELGQVRWLRQAPECMLENGQLHPALKDGRGLKWGATLDGDTVIRRSAVGVNRTHDVLFVAITNHTSARVLADGMHHAGAVDVAQLDVNWSYPKFVTFEPRKQDGELVAIALADGFEYSPDEYVRKRQRRDFFYITRKDGEFAAKPAP